MTACLTTPTNLIAQVRVTPADSNNKTVATTASTAVHTPMHCLPTVFLTPVAVSGMVLPYPPPQTNTLGRHAWATRTAQTNTTHQAAQQQQLQHHHSSQHSHDRQLIKGAWAKAAQQHHRPMPLISMWHPCAPTSFSLTFCALVLCTQPRH